MPIGINTDKAKEIHKDYIREVRKPLLEQEDVSYMRAVEADDATAKEAIVIRKQALRDATNIVGITTITATDVMGVTNQLKVVWDTDVLGENPLV